MLPSMTVNRSFIQALIAAEAPCCGLGLVEVNQKKSGFVAMRPGEVIPEASQNLTPGRDTCKNAHISPRCLCSGHLKVYYSATPSVEKRIGQAMISSKGKGLVNKSRM